MIIIVDNDDSLAGITFLESPNGNFIPIHEGQFFTGTIIDHHGELVYESGNLVEMINYNERILH